MTDLPFELGKPFWLSAYPNEGSLDYFGFRFYRQPMRKCLVRGAAANNFKTAKTLIYFAAISYAFRIENKIGIEDELTEEQIATWQEWYKTAYYLYIVSSFAKYERIIDTGFTGASDEYEDNFSKLLNGTLDGFSIKDAHIRMFPDNREWGYLAQFWKAPLDYFRCVIDINHCVFGEYAEECYCLLSEDKNWQLFIKILEDGIIRNNEFQQIQKILECVELSNDEKLLAKRIIFDKAKKYPNDENNEYKQSYYLLKTLFDNGFDDFSVETGNDFATIFSYTFLNNIKLGAKDIYWQVLLSSLTFEIGINRLYSFMVNNVINNGVLSREKLKQRIYSLVDEWISNNNFGQSLEEVKNQWSEKYLTSIDNYQELFKEMLDKKKLEYSLDGILQGYLISEIKIEDDIAKSYEYQNLTDKYHYFIPQAFFKNKEISNKSSFHEFIFNMATCLIEEQYSFSIDRMTYFNQKAKFIFIKSNLPNEYILQIDKENFIEFRGIIDMIDSCISLWDTAGIWSK